MLGNSTEYSEELSSHVRTAVQRVLSRPVIACHQLLGGKVNYVYRLETRDQSFVAKVFKRGWPEDGKLPWIEQQLTKFSVPHAKLIHYLTGDPHFPHGFTIS